MMCEKDRMRNRAEQTERRRKQKHQNKNFPNSKTETKENRKAYKQEHRKSPVNLPNTINTNATNAAVQLDLDLSPKKPLPILLPRGKA
jgi:hypothetical protein